MGSWGYGPMDSDTACDWFSKIQNEIDRGLRSKWLEERIAAAHVAVCLAEGGFEFGDAPFWVSVCDTVAVICMSAESEDYKNPQARAACLDELYTRGVAQIAAVRRRECLIQAARSREEDTKKWSERIRLRSRRVRKKTKKR